MAPWRRIFLLLLVPAALVAGCGSDGEEIPPESAEKLEARLDEVERGFATGNCEGDEDSAEASADLLLEHVMEGEQSELPPGVDPELRDTLVAAANQLRELVEEQCVQRTDDSDSGDDAPEDTGEVPDETEETEPPPDAEQPEDEAEQPEDRSGGEEESPDKGPEGEGPEGEGPPGQDGQTPPSGGTGAPEGA